MAARADPRLSFQEALELVKLPSQDGPSSQAQRFMATRAAHLPGVEIEFSMHVAAYGGHVYGQAALAACRALRELEDEKGMKPSERLGLHVRRMPLHFHPELPLMRHRQSTATSPGLDTRIGPTSMMPPP